MTQIFNKHSQLDKRRILRQRQTKTEEIMWNNLRNRKFLGYKFKRQYSVSCFVLDFYCSELKLAIEVDGKYHDNEEIKKYDRDRQEYIESLGIKVIRIKNEEIISDLKNVLRSIEEQIKYL